MEVPIQIQGIDCISVSFLFYGGCFFISIKARLTNRRQPILAYSTRRKNLPTASSGVINNQSLLHVNTTMGTPKSNKRKLGGCTPTVTPSANKLIKRSFYIYSLNIIEISFFFAELDCRLELVQLKEENKLLEEVKYFSRNDSSIFISLFSRLKPI